MDVSINKKARRIFCAAAAAGMLALGAGCDGGEDTISVSVDNKTGMVIDSVRVEIQISAGLEGLVTLQAAALKELGPNEKKSLSISPHNKIAGEGAVFLTAYKDSSKTSYELCGYFYTNPFTTGCFGVDAKLSFAVVEIESEIYIVHAFARE